jgi:hypothetical protein
MNRVTLRRRCQYEPLTGSQRCALFGHAAQTVDANGDEEQWLSIL